MRLEAGDALPDLLALGFYPFHGRYPVRFDDGARHRWLDPKALRKRHRLFDELIRVQSTPLLYRLTTDRRRPGWHFSDLSPVVPIVN